MTNRLRSSGSSETKPLSSGAPSSDTSSSLFVADGVVDLPFNPAYVSYSEFNDHGPSLVVSSFFNVEHNPDFVAGGNNNNGTVVPPYIPFERDLVALVVGLDDGNGDGDDQVEIKAEGGGAPMITVIELTDALVGGPPQTYWPNYAQRVPDGVFPFEAIVVPQGWFAIPQLGRLTVVDVVTQQEYVIHQSTAGEPWFYHQVLFIDMDQDGWIDLVTARSSFKVMPAFNPPTAELVWFQNPGLDAFLLQPNVEWEEHVIVAGPDVALDAYDLDGDGVPEIVATQFFAGLPQFLGSPWGSPSRLTLYGTPTGQTWANYTEPLRVADILTDQGMVFGCEFVDLNKDGLVDILVTNHQTPSSAIPGRVMALEQPPTGRIFEDPWTVHILLDNISPAPAPEDATVERMAPGSATSFRPVMGESDSRPFVVVSGDEAAKVWILEPSSADGDSTWEYDSRVIFDINEYYGPGTTHTPLEDPFGVTISTIGEIGIREGGNGARLYVPVFEATDIHVFRYRESTPGPTPGPTPEPTPPSSDDDSAGYSHACGGLCFIVALLATMFSFT